MKQCTGQTDAMSDVMSIAMGGLHASTARFEASAKRLVQQRHADFARELVEQKLAAAEFKANLAVIKTANQMTKSALDILA